MNLDRMMLIVNYPHITKLKNLSACLERYPRIRVAQIAIDYLAYGWSVEEMCYEHPYLSLAEAHAAMAYYFDHQEEIDTEIREDWEQTQREINQSVSSPFYVQTKARGLL